MCAGCVPEEGEFGLSTKVVKIEIHTAAAPQAVGPYSQAVMVHDQLFCSGQIPLDPATGELVSGGFEAQVERVFDNLEAVVAAAGLTLDHATKVTIYMTDLAKFPALNEIYARRFTEPFPARATVGVASLPKGAEVEIDLVATAI
jgi:2-iminobutanoate/2-iminopropanoate deaminase